jgi:hypothetical protein
LMDDSVETPIKYFNRISNFHSIIGLWLITLDN